MKRPYFHIQCGLASLLIAWLPSTKANILAEPDDPTICVPQIMYQSPFCDYQPHDEVKRESWLKANSDVTRKSEHTHSSSVDDESLQQHDDN